MVPVALAYLALPHLLFCAGWLLPWPAALGLLALAGTLYPVFENGQARECGRWPAPARALSLLALAVAWTSFGGAGHLFHANQDWVVRDAVLHDLVAGSWPVGYATLSGDDLVLRAPIAYFLPAALAGKLTGAPAHWALLAWTTGGVWLFLCMVCEDDTSRAQTTLKMAVMVLFSGMDIFGALIATDPLAFDDHLEWWPRTFQYSSNTTLLFWAPNHALPGWFAATILWRQWSRPNGQWVLAPLLALIPLWSPLTALGVLPLATTMLVTRWRQGMAPRFSVAGALGATVLAAGSVAYLTAQSSQIRAGWVWTFATSALSQAFVYLLFVGLEFGVLLVLILRVERRPAVIAAGVTLSCLPVYLFGEANDLVMRASIPSLAILAIAVVPALERLWGEPTLRLRAVAVALVLLIGAATPVTEFTRALLRPYWQASSGTDLFEATAGEAMHYLARARGSAALDILAPVHTLPGVHEPVTGREP